MALVPEAIAFSFVAGVEPLVGLYAAFIVGIITSIFGGRSGMISGATGAMAVVMVSLVSVHGEQYLFATVILMGLIQLLAGIFKLGNLYFRKDRIRRLKIKIRYHLIFKFIDGTFHH